MICMSSCTLFSGISAMLDVRGKHERHADYFDVSEDFMKKAVCWYKFGNLDVDSYFGQ